VTSMQDEFGVQVIDAAVRQFFAEHGGPCRLIAAVSGGADSTVLLFALADLREAGFDVHAAHVNHHLRGAESDADEAFVRSMCRDLGVELHVSDGMLDPERIRARGLEAAAREVRYARLAEIRTRTNARFVATAHQKNDQAETVLMRLVTGSGIAALRGIHPVRDDGFVRPLLDVTRAEIDAFLAERGVTPRHDRSNDDARFLRNRIRSVMREMEERAIPIVDGLAAVAAQARQQWPILERAIDEAERVCVDVRADETVFLTWPDDAWLRQALLHRHIHRLDSEARDVSARDLERLAAEVDTIRRVSVTKRLELIRRGTELVLRGPRVEVGAFELELTPDVPAFVPELGVTVEVRLRREPPLTLALSPPLRGEGTVLREWFESPLPSGERVRVRGGSRAHCSFQLPPNSPPRFVVRNRRPGDRFQPLGMGKAKKLKDFLIDRKIAVDLRDRLPLLLWNDEIVWVAGVEVSERFKVTGAVADRYEVWLEGPVASDDDRDSSRLHC
jgi:tRNA(Ile)-lysidine synthase